VHFIPAANHEHTIIYGWSVSFMTTLHCISAHSWLILDFGIVGEQVSGKAF